MLGCKLVWPCVCGTESSVDLRGRVQYAQNPPLKRTPTAFVGATCFCLIIVSVLTPLQYLCSRYVHNSCRKELLGNHHNQQGHVLLMSVAQLLLLCLNQQYLATSQAVEDSDQYNFCILSTSIVTLVSIEDSDQYNFCQYRNTIPVLSIIS